MNCKDSPYEYNGVKVPRVTEIISKCIHEESLMQWSNSLGFKHQSYKKVLDIAADYGSRTHKGIEYYLKGLDIPENTPLNSLYGFKSWWNILSNNNKLSILGQEQKLVCKWYGGTYDLLLSINDKIYLVDFKTSNHITYRYYLQLAAYNRILRSQNINISGTILLQLSKTNTSFTEYTLNLDNESHRSYFLLAEKTFLGILHTYYNIDRLGSEFNEVHKR